LDHSAGKIEKNELRNGFQIFDNLIFLLWRRGPTLYTRPSALGHKTHSDGLRL
jgi:hypothetical protein